MEIRRPGPSPLRGTYLQGEEVCGHSPSRSLHVHQPLTETLEPPLHPLHNGSNRQLIITMDPADTASFVTRPLLYTLAAGALIVILTRRVGYKPNSRRLVPAWVMIELAITILIIGNGPSSFPHRI